ncbi:hypothetical protein [uncultured Microbacterium sp.]|uniref:hypothetical protein n=1 Tax=uncultured Microbacterium sp. TaxID=191216 RepID=UPI0025DD5741|nr:hypothetical protein [uncultured Microbacterium sp.]
MVIETVRPGVQFVPDAAAAFRRADAQVRAEFGRGIDVNSTYRSWADQMVMFINWGRYVAGKGPYPGHSKAVHPSESFHVAGIALDSDDWRIPRIVAILAENGFIRNRLHVSNENHHFEWLRNRDRNYGKPLGAPESAGGASTPEIESLLEDAMANPIIDVDSTLWIGRNDGTFEQYETWKATNSRGIISKVFFGGKGGTDDKIPKLSAPDFEVAKTVWRQMCRGTAEAVWSHKIPAQDGAGKPVVPARAFRADGFLASTNAIVNASRES